MTRRAIRRPLSLFTVIIFLMSSLVLTTPDVGASTDHARVHMPNVVGLTRAQVYAAMKRTQLFFRTEGPGSSNARWVSVVRESPAAGALVPWRSTVTLITSLADSHEPRRMPRLVGLTKDRVYAAKKRAQLYFRTRGPGSADGRWTAVTRQSPAPGTLVAWHDTVTVSTSQSVAHARRRVPRLIGLSRARAGTIVQSSQLRLRTQGLGATNNTWTRVVRQSPAPGTLVAWHSIVVVSVTKPVSRLVSSTPTPTPTSTSSSTTSSTTTTTYPGETTTSTSSTTTTTAPVTTTTRKPSTTDDYRIGDATWYVYTPGRCATWYLPYGTRVTVRDLATGRAIVCVVTDKEAAHGDRVVDLNQSQFAQLAPLATGVIRVKVSW
jgi:beta-lactam-binding protein with PASTA domain